MDKANNTTFYANRKELEELHEAYTTDIEGTLGIQAIEFKDIEEIENKLKKLQDVKPIGRDAELAKNRREYIY